MQTTSPGRDPGADQVQLVEGSPQWMSFSVKFSPGRSSDNVCSICKQDESPMWLNLAKSDEKLSLRENKLYDMSWKEDWRR